MSWERKNHGGTATSNESKKYAIFIGRFQPYHYGHIELIEQKLKEGNEFSKKNNLPIYENLMVPKSKGLWFIIKHLKKLNKLGRIWDATIILSKFIKKSIESFV